MNQLEYPTKTLPAIVLILFLLLIPLLGGCHRVKEGDITSQQGKEIDIDLDASRTVYMSDLFQDIRYVKLENVEGHLVGSIQKILIKDGILFILERTTPSIFLYDLSGHYINQIPIYKGRGPQNMISVTDFSVDVDKKQIVVLGFLKMLTFTYQGKFIQGRSLGINPTRFSILSDGTYAFFMNSRTYSSEKIKNTGYNLLYTGKSGHTKFLPIPKYKANLTLRVSNNFPRYNGKQLFYFAPSYKIYELKADHIAVRYTLNFGKYNVPASFFKQRKNLNEGYKFIEKTIKEGYASYLANFLETDPLLSFSIYWNRDKAYQVFYSKKKHTSFVAEKLVNDMDGGLTPYFIAAYHNELVYFIQPADLLKKVQRVRRSKDSRNPRYRGLIKFAEGMDPLDNPIIMFAKTK